ncbi:glycosyltransferase family 2 protein [Flagellimonas sp. S174]|uniref:glycosyltransferase family 2 protein n=1 Tax=Flagellimonas sp. S174 TaxID=3410790 RepID=UPI003BF4D586
MLRTKGLKIDVSIIIPVYNSSQTVSKTIHSVINQTHRNYECIIVDDGSDDGTYEMALQITKEDKRFKVFKRENQKNNGGSVCRNEGLKISTGRYIIFLDSDDLLAPDCLSIRLGKMIQNKQINIGIFNTAIIGKRSMLFTRFTKNPLAGFLMGNYPWHTMSPIWERNFLVNNLGGFNEGFPRLQDIEIHTRALLDTSVNFKFFPFSKVDSYYIIGKTTKNDENKKKRQIIGYLEFLDQTLKIIGSDKTKRKHLTKTFFLLIDAIDTIDLNPKIDSRVNSICQKLEISKFDLKRITLFRYMMVKMPKYHIFWRELFFFNIYRVLFFSQKILFSGYHKFKHVGW